MKRALVVLLLCGSGASGSEKGAESGHPVGKPCLHASAEQVPAFGETLLPRAAIGRRPRDITPTVAETASRNAVEIAVGAATASDGGADHRGNGSQIGALPEAKDEHSRNSGGAPPRGYDENGLVKAFTGATLPDTAAADGSGFESTSTSVATDAKAASTDAASPVSAPADALDEDEGFDGGFGGYGGRGYMTVADAMAEFGAGFVTSAGRCFPADSRVLTPSGPRRLGDLKHGDLVTNHAGRPEKVLAVAHAAANGGNLRGNRHKKGVRAGAAMMITLETAIGAITLHADHPVQDGSGRMLTVDNVAWDGHLTTASGRKVEVLSMSNAAVADYRNVYTDGTNGIIVNGFRVSTLFEGSVLSGAVQALAAANDAAVTAFGWDLFALGDGYLATAVDAGEATARYADWAWDTAVSMVLPSSAG